MLDLLAHCLTYIIRAGRDTLTKKPRGDALDFVPCDKDQQREHFYRERRKIELTNREAIANGNKFFEPRSIQINAR